MKKIILIIIGLAIQVSSQTNITIPMLNFKSSLDSTDLFLISQSDTNYYKYTFDRLIDQVEDSLNKTQIAYKNAANTFTSSQTFTGGLTSSNNTNISGVASFTNNLTISGSTVFNSRPTFNGALFNAAPYGLIRFNDSTYFYSGVSTFYNNPVVFDGNSDLTIYGQINMISGAKLRLPAAIYSINYSSLGYVGSDGNSYLVFDYGSSGGNRDTISSFRYLRNNYARVNAANTFSSDNVFDGDVVMNKRLTLNEQLVNKIDSVQLSAGSVNIDVSVRSPLIVLYSNEDAPEVTGITGYHGQEVTFLIHPSTYTTIGFTNNSSIKLKNNSNAGLNGKDIITFVNYRGVWYEKSRSEN